LEFNVPFQHKYGYIRDEGGPGKKGRKTVVCVCVCVREKHF